MISFIWSSEFPLLAGTGGTENYTIGQIRELNARGIPARIVSVGLGENDGRENFPDIEFLAVKDSSEIFQLDDLCIFVSSPVPAPTKHPSYTILHCPPQSFLNNPVSVFYNKSPSFFRRHLSCHQIITASKFSAKLWSDITGCNRDAVSIAYPFAEKHFGIQPIKRHRGKKTRVLFGGRLKPEKGIYTLLAAWHMLDPSQFEFTVTTAGTHDPDGKVIKKMLDAHPNVTVIPARQTSEEMAELLAEIDIVAMPSTIQFWYEMFGILSVEAQHSGCRVVASNSGGLPETDCGGLSLVEPDNPEALADGIRKAAELGRLNSAQRKIAAQHFTVQKSVDSLLDAINWPSEPKDLLKLDKPSGLSVKETGLKQ